MDERYLRTKKFLQQKAWFMVKQTNLFRSTNLPSLGDCFLVWNDLGLSEIVDKKKEKKKKAGRWLVFSGFFFFSFYPGSKRNICISWYDMSQVEDVWYLSANIFHAPLYCLWIHTTFEEPKTVTDGEDEPGFHT